MVTSENLNIYSPGHELIHPFETDPMKFFKNGDVSGTNGAVATETLDSSVVTEPCADQVVTDAQELSSPLYAEPKWLEESQQEESGNFPNHSFETTVMSAAGVGVVATDSMFYGDSISSEEQSVKSRAKNLFRKMKHPILTASLATAAVGTWAFEVGPANENLRADVAVELLNNGHKAVVAGIAVGGITMAVETATGLLTSATIDVKGGVLGRFNRFLFRNTEQMETTNKDGHKKTDTVLGLAGGSTPVIIERQRRNPERKFKDNAKTAVAAAGGIAAFSGALTGVAGDLIEWASVNDFYEQANGIKETLEDWRTWLGVFALMKTIEHKDKLKSAIKPKQEQHEPVIQAEEMSSEVPEPASRDKQMVKRVAQVAGGIAFIGLGGPSHIADAISSIEVNGINPVYKAGSFLADNQAIDKIEDYGSYLWDWRLWSTSFVSLMGATKLVQKIKGDKKATA